MRKRIVVAVVAVLAAVGVGVPASPAGAADPRAQASVEGRYAVGVRTETFVDGSRPTDPNGTYPGAPDRTLPTMIWYPAQGAPGGPDVTGAPAVRGRRFPLLVFVHGFTGTGPVYGGLLRRIASAGYVVAAPTFPLSNGLAPGGPRLIDVFNQPADVSFVIDELLRLDADPASPLGSVLWRRRIAVGGHSLGGVTTLGMLNSCCRDGRVDAYIPMSGIEIPFSGSYTRDFRAPLLLIHGDADSTVPFGASQAAFASARGPKYLLDLLGGSHIPFGAPYGDVLIDTVIHFLDRYLKDAPGSIRALIQDGTVAGASQLTRGQ